MSGDVIQNTARHTLSSSQGHVVDHGCEAGMQMCDLYIPLLLFKPALIYPSVHAGVLPSISVVSISMLYKHLLYRHKSNEKPTLCLSSVSDSGTIRTCALRATRPCGGTGHDGSERSTGWH